MLGAFYVAVKNGFKDNLHCVLCLLGTACSILPIVFIVYLGIYAFNNPDQEAWYGLDKNGK